MPKIEPKKKPADPLAIYATIDPVRKASDLFRTRTPRLKREAETEWLAFVSDMLTNDHFVTDPDEGVVTDIGHTLEQVFELWLSTRPHVVVPQPIVDNANETWLSEDGAPLNLTRQVERYNELKLQFGGNDKAATVALHEEAALYGATVGSRKPGVAPVGKETSDKKAAPAAAAGLSTNPWSASFNGTEDQRNIRISEILKTRGTAFASALAKAAGTTAMRPLPLAKK
jgi:hypothetical protein